MNIEDTSEVDGQTGSGSLADRIADGELTLYEGNNLLYALLGATCLSRHRIDKISNFLHSGKFIGLFVLSVVIFIISAIFAPIEALITVVLILEFELFLVLLVFDKRILWLQLKSFDTLYKLYNGNLLMLSFVLQVTVKALTTYLFVISAWVLLNVYIIAVSSFDAINLTNKTKIALLTINALFWIAQYVGLYFSFRDVDEATIKILNQDVSLRAVLLGCLLNMIIFSLKQLFYVIFWPLHAAVLAIGPKIIWKRD